MPLPVPNRDDWLESLFLLSYSQGGYGPALGLAGLLEMDGGDRETLSRIAVERREAEIEAAKQR